MFRRLFSLLLLSGFALQTNFLMSEINSSIFSKDHSSGGFHHGKELEVKNLNVHKTLKAGTLIVKENADIKGNLEVDGVVQATAFLTPAGALSVIKQAYGKLSASTPTGHLVITTPQVSLPSVAGWQPFPVDTFSTSLNVTAAIPDNATMTVQQSGTYLITANLTLQYPTPGTDGPDDISGYCIGVNIDGVVQSDSLGSLHISTEAGQENPGLLFSASLSGLYTLAAGDTVQFVIQGTSADNTKYMVVASANGSISQVGN